MYRVKANATPRLRVRSKPTLSSDVLGGFLPGREINVTTIANGWATIRTADDLTAYVSAAYIEDTSVPPPPVGDYRKISLHIHTGNNAAACVNVYRDCAKAGKPIPLAVVINNVCIVEEIKRVSPQTFVVLRAGVVGGQDVLPLVPDDNQANFLAGEKRFNERFIPCSADAYQVANEHYSNAYPSWKVEAMAQFYIGVISAVRARGKLATVGDFSVGGPEFEHLELMQPMLTKAEEFGCPLNYHGYAPPNVYDMTYQSEYYSMRWERVVQNYPKLRVVIGETGGYHNNGPDIMGMMRQYQAMLATNKTVIGAAVFTANAAIDWQNSGFGFDGYLDSYSAWFRNL